MKYYTYETFNTYITSTFQEVDQDIESRVKAIIEDVRRHGDQALFKYTKAFDGIILETIKVSPQAIKEAYQETSQTLIDALKKAISNIKTYHEKQSIPSFQYEAEGRIIGQKVTPLEAVGIYIPGGTASYPSTVLMNVIPAQIAGVKSITLITPPNKEGKVDPLILVAAYLLHISTIYMVGGAQGVAALTYGTETIKKVDKIVGPGNRYVATAKKLVSGYVGIDTIAGPSEVCIVADRHANPSYVASDLLAQAEHDVFAKAICISDDQSLLDQVDVEVKRQLEGLKRVEIAKQSIESYGALVKVDSLKEAFKLVNVLAPEHLEVQVEAPFTYLDQIKHAGAIFLGPYTPEPVGDYMAGPNHTLPTSSTARFSSGLSTYDFLKRTSYVSYNQQALLEDADAIMAIALEEGLEAHALSVKVRL